MPLPAFPLNISETATGAALNRKTFKLFGVAGAFLALAGGLGVYFNRKTFAALGGLGVYTCLDYFAFSVFAGSIFFPFALATFGLSLIVGAVLYQKNAKALRAWLLKLLGRKS